MNKRRIIPFILGIALFLSFNAVVADDIPSPPHRFKGFVVDQTGELIADNSTVSAVVNGVYYNTTTKDGKYGNTLLTEEFLVEGSEGDTINFYINGTQTSQTAIFTSGGLNINFAPFLNLSLDTPSLTINSVSSHSITTSSAVISWTTNKSANSTVNFGTTTALENTKKDPSFEKNHDVTLSNLQSGTTYYFEVVSYDYTGNKASDNNSGNYYSFTTGEDSGGGGNGGSPGGGGGTQPPVPEENIPPVADAGGPYYGDVDQIIYFDSSKSSDTDGYIVEYSWDFGDGATNNTENVRKTHSYSTIGNYTITLTVTDNNGATNSTTTFAFISLTDTDGDGWSDESEIYYETDPNNISDYPSDSDNDGVPDSWDSDDDNDGLTDETEEELGTNPNNSDDVIRIINEYGLFFLIDTTNDNEIDSYYNTTSGEVTELFKKEDGSFLIDTDNDGQYDYVYTSTLNSILPYQKIEGKQESQKQDTNMLSYIVLIFVIIILIITVYLKFRRR